ncbi:MAG: hypothetical protein E3J47_08265 [Candidatus Stahlbacteria bacterium]|nr:MAG: hypothetical protein E3J47_08265 [Candidatus Stahlbacteria bacterium]
MIIILALLIIAVVIIYSSWRYSNESNGMFAGVVCTIFLVVICCVTWHESYNSYLTERAFYSATKEQYHSAIEVYSNYAVIDMGKAAFTDLKYQGYQENVGKFIIDLRNRIIKYNSAIVEKRIMGKNPVYSWFIVEPDDDMVIIKMKAEQLHDKDNG